MKRQDYIIFFALVALLFAWPGIYQKFFADKTPPPERIESTEQAVDQAVDGATASVTRTPPARTQETDSAPLEVVEHMEPAEVVEEQFVLLTNHNVRLVLSSQGAAIKAATLNNYREGLARDSGPVVLDFSERSALAYSGIPGLSENYHFQITESEDGRVILDRRAADGLRLRREVSLDEHYMVIVRDTFINESNEPRDLGQHMIRTGAISQEEAHEDFAGMVNMGVDSLPPAGGVENWGAAIPKQFRAARDEAGASRLPETVQYRPTTKPADWVAAKNKYFVQILMPDGDGADWIEVYARREITPAERAGARVKDALVEAVGASLGFVNQTLAPGESYTRTYEYFVGPKNYGILSKLSHSRDGAMGFEENAYMDFIVVPTAKLLLRLLNLIHDHVWNNYGVAIILLTLIVRIVFWPITHKSTESMRRMAAVQPLMAEIREKFKDNPQKMQQAMMALYKEHKINPLGGCLPMLVQIPVFFALFVVLRIAIELRFAEFLWISDLSAPERIIEFGFTIPLLGWDALNILPLLMTATMIIQQKLTPTAGDPAQQRIMMIMMPAMMLFFLYNFASGLALYWTTQNVLMIVQQLVYKQRKKREAAATA
ncbi:MAG TPA: membrane protein insertase YidC [Kiritimatiellia bacterium]|nr:membrane protein insertase YidC [Kiritimatiellia bacterium]